MCLYTCVLLLLFLPTYLERLSSLLPCVLSCPSKALYPAATFTLVSFETGFPCVALAVLKLAV